MIEFSLTKIAEVTHGQLQGTDAVVASVTTDSRSLQAGDFFIALKGPRFDGHSYLQQAADKDAAGAMVSDDVQVDLPCVKVQDTRIGLGELAAAWRQKSKALVIGITGSNGKTTVKEMLAAILSCEGSVLATQGNLNNDIGLPLTLMRLQNEDFAVVELGANHPGEIDYLSTITAPNVAVLNNAGRAHLEGFGDERGVARAKLEIINGLSEQGVFVYNGDDAFASMWAEVATHRKCVRFGLQPEHDVHSPADSLDVQWTDAGFISTFKVCTDDGDMTINMQLAGEHNRMNALAAVAAAQCAGAKISSIVQGLALLEAVPGRLCLLSGLSGMRLIDDSYNANPDSVAMAIQVLSTAPGKRTLVLGDLGELGADSAALHEEAGYLAKDAGIDRLFTCGDLSAAASESFGLNAQHYSDQTALIQQLQKILGAGDTVLIKGSRAASMDRVVAALHEVKQAC